MMDGHGAEMSEFYATQQVEDRSVASRIQQSVEMSETQSGIGWKFANQGENTPSGNDFLQQTDIF